MSCSPLSVGADASLSSTLTSLDCQVNGAVAGGYGRLFGAGGAFGAALTATLTLFVVLIALGLLTGRTRLTLSTMAPKALALGLVLTFATAWPAYQAVVYGLLTGGPDEIASAFLGAHSGATQAFAGRLDALFDAIVEAGQAVAQVAKSPNLVVATSLTWVSALMLLLSTVGLLVVARIVLAVLLALGPIFILFGLFGATRGLFEGWLRTSVSFALAPMLIVIGGSGLMAVLAPLITAITDDPAAAVSDLRPVVTLFLAAMIYAGLTVALACTAVALTRGWRLRLAPGTAAPQISAGASAERPASASINLAAASAPPASDPRVTGLVSAVLRDESRTSDATRIQIQALPPLASAAATTPTAAGPRRREGLGQSFRAAPPRRALAGSLGS